MKFTVASALAIFATVLSMAAAQSDGTACTTCLDASLGALPSCANLGIAMGNFTPTNLPQYAVCLCSSLDGAWIEKCRTTCGEDVMSFKNTYAENLKSAGLICGSQPSFSGPM